MAAAPEYPAAFDGFECFIVAYISVRGVDHRVALYRAKPVPEGTADYGHRHEPLAEFSALVPVIRSALPEGCDARRKVSDELRRKGPGGVDKDTPFLVKIADALHHFNMLRNRVESAGTALTKEDELALGDVLLFLVHNCSDEDGTVILPALGSLGRQGILARLRTTDPEGLRKALALASTFCLVPSWMRYHGGPSLTPTQMMRQVLCSLNLFLRANGVERVSDLASKPIWKAVVERVLAMEHPVLLGFGERKEGFWAADIFARVFRPQPLAYVRVAILETEKEEHLLLMDDVIVRLRQGLLALALLLKENVAVLEHGQDGKSKVAPRTVQTHFNVLLEDSGLPAEVRDMIKKEIADTRDFRYSDMTSPRLDASPTFPDSHLESGQGHIRVVCFLPNGEWNLFEFPTKDFAESKNLFVFQQLFFFWLAQLLYPNRLEELQPRTITRIVQTKPGLWSTLTLFRDSFTGADVETDVEESDLDEAPPEPPLTPQRRKLSMPPEGTGVAVFPGASGLGSVLGMGLREAAFQEMSASNRMKHAVMANKGMTIYPNEGAGNCLCICLEACRAEFYNEEPRNHMVLREEIVKSMREPLRLRLLMQNVTDDTFDESYLERQTEEESKELNDHRYRFLRVNRMINTLFVPRGGYMNNFGLLEFGHLYPDVEIRLFKWNANPLNTLLTIGDNHHDNAVSTFYVLNAFEHYELCRNDVRGSKKILAEHEKLGGDEVAINDQKVAAEVEKARKAKRKGQQKGQKQDENGRDMYAVAYLRAWYLMRETSWLQTRGINSLRSCKDEDQQELFEMALDEVLRGLVAASGHSN